MFPQTYRRDYRDTIMTSCKCLLSLAFVSIVHKLHDTFTLTRGTASGLPAKPGPSRGPSAEGSPSVLLRRKLAREGRGLRC